MLKKKLRNQKGFTLIEIIAVLVILGILAAVAIPKYFDLQNEARKKAVEGAIAAGASQLSMQFAQDLLAGTATASTWTHSSAGQPLGDFTATLTGACGAGTTKGSTVLITAGPDWYASYVSDGGGSVSRTFGICYK